ncbi:hypothetical protein ZWY2020_041267 [Hordeum vulgare]|nr:hypothetical protein ZWY2020_041267 [Hordeum vulgare]
MVARGWPERSLEEGEVRGGESLEGSPAAEGEAAAWEGPAAERREEDTMVRYGVVATGGRVWEHVQGGADGIHRWWTKQQTDCSRVPPLRGKEGRLVGANRVARRSALAACEATLATAGGQRRDRSGASQRRCRRGPTAPLAGSSCDIVGAHRNLLLFRLTSNPVKGEDGESLIGPQEYFICQGSPLQQTLQLHRIPMFTHCSLHLRSVSVIAVDTISKHVAIHQYIKGEEDLEGEADDMVRRKSRLLHPFVPSEFPKFFWPHQLLSLWSFKNMVWDLRKSCCRFWESENEQRPWRRERPIRASSCCRPRLLPLPARPNSSSLVALDPIAGRARSRSMVTQDALLDHCCYPIALRSAAAPGNNVRQDSNILSNLW